MDPELISAITEAVQRFVRWLDRYGETSQDHQDFYNGWLGRTAKRLYYRHPAVGTAAVLPMVFCEAFAPGTRQWFYPPQRLPIADAHYAMGFALLYEATGNRAYYERAVHFLGILENTRCPAYEQPTWGYPFDWQTREGLIQAGTPLITTIPYCYEAFDAVHHVDGHPHWREIMRGIAEHVLADYDDIPTGPDAASCTYFPHHESGVVNASAYRAFLLTHAHNAFGDQRYRHAADLNLNFVLHMQRPDGSWPYAVDGIRNFVDHFHTCFVLKALGKINRLTGDDRCKPAIDRGIQFYLRNLFDAHGMPRPFARAPRLTFYRTELYDCAECLNLAHLLGSKYPELSTIARRVARRLLQSWQVSNGSFRSRKLLIGYDNVPMHRWGQSQIFRSLTLLMATSPRIMKTESNTIGRGTQ